MNLGRSRKVFLTVLAEQREILSPFLSARLEKLLSEDGKLITSHQISELKAYISLLNLCVTHV